MLFVRPAGPADFDALMELAVLSGPGFTSLPEHEPTLRERLATSEASFTGALAPLEVLVHPDARGLPRRRRWWAWPA